MGFAKTERDWAERAARHLKAELKRADVTYEELAERLKKLTAFRKPKRAYRTSWRERRCPHHFSLHA